MSESGEKIEKVESQRKIEEIGKAENHKQKEVIQIEDGPERFEICTRTGLVYSRKKSKGFESNEETKGTMTSKQKFKIIGLFGDANPGRDLEFTKASIELGFELARRGITVVYEGGMGGLKGNVALAASINGSKVLSILVKGLDDHLCTVGSEVKVMSLPERMGFIFSCAEAFVVVPGGMETLGGLFSIAYWASQNFHRKPLGLLNINGFYDSLLFFLNQATEHGFIPKEVRKTILSAPTACQLLDQMQNYEPESSYPMWSMGRQSSINRNIPRSLPAKDEPGLDTSLRL